MKKFKLYSSTIFIFILLSQSCNFSDTTDDLGNGYFYRNEGDLVRDILCKKANGGEIPATVLSYDFDDNFIVAKQKPKLPQDALYTNEFKYSKGNQAIYYWLIVKNENRVLGPFSLDEFNIQREIFKVPNQLILK